MVANRPAKSDRLLGFPKEVAQWFWTTVLTTRPDSSIRRWHDYVIRKPKELVGRLR